MRKRFHRYVTQGMIRRVVAADLQMRIVQKTNFVVIDFHRELTETEEAALQQLMRRLGYGEARSERSG